LRRAGAGEVYVAANGYEALDMLERHPITAMIIDFRMPGIHGLELLKRIRTGKTSAPRNLICVMLTGHAVRHLVGLAIVLDCDTFLAKPVSLETLVKHLNRSLQYRFDPLPVEHYEAVDVRHADAFLRTGVPQPAAEKGKNEEDTFIDTPKAAASDTLPLTDETRISPEADKPAPKAAVIMPLPAKPAAAKPAPTRAAPKSASKASPKPAAKPGAASKPAAAANRPMKCVNLSDVPDGAVIAKNITGRTGTLLVAAGTPFRARYARRLQEISDIEGEIKDVWIYE
jgi:CheY-like chemotaxis protein